VPEPEPAHYDLKFQHPPKDNSPDRFSWIFSLWKCQCFG
jgi:hypothetical protein